jgi:hypothetical protein
MNNGRSTKQIGLRAKINRASFFYPKIVWTTDIANNIHTDMVTKY